MAYQRSRYGGGGGYGNYGGGGGGLTLSFPPFTPMVKWLLGINTAVFLLYVLSSAVGGRGLFAQMVALFGLVPLAVVQGWLWQLVTYSFLHLGFWHWFGNMLALWMFGSSMEGAWGGRRFLELFFVGVVGAALFSVIISFSGVLGSPTAPTVGASGGVYAILIAFGTVFSENEIFMFPFPFRIKAKYFVAILIVLTVVFSLQEANGTNHLAHLGGLLFGYAYVKFAPTRGLRTSASEGLFGLRNRYYRWKRRRAARKFEVYMRKQNKPTNLSEYFDEYGNYKDPSMRPKEEKNDRKSDSGWVN